jgi:hypothetical protein
LLWSLGCGDSTSPDRISTTGIGEYAATIDPGAGNVLLATVAVSGPDGLPVDVHLIGSNLRVEPTQSPIGAIVSLDVSMLNQGSIPLYAPAEVVLRDLKPSGVTLINGDRTMQDSGGTGSTIGSALSIDPSYELLYTELLGADRVLSPGEESGTRTWSFQLPQMGSFSFGATARFGLEPGGAFIAGTLFWDSNANGHWDNGEGPAGGGSVTLTAPSGQEMSVAMGANGRYEFEVLATGLYSVQCVPPPTFAPVRFTTPNPLAVVLSPRPDGRPETVLDAHFGIVTDLPGDSPPVLFHEGPGSELKQDSYTLRGIHFTGRYLNLDVGFSGCGPDHPLALYMVGGFMESSPVQANLVLSHDDRGELCDAYWQRSLRFDLQPILDRYVQTYGAPGQIRVNFRAADGKITTFLINGGGYPPD